MKRLTTSSSFSRLDEQQDGNLIPLSLTVEGKRKYDDRFQSTLCLDGMEEVEEEDELCAMGQSCLGEKKRRLSAEQVKALEKNFEVENKLDPERKVRLAQEIGLQPRQVAVWFQNRRARWKTKLLEHDYGALKARHDALKIDCEALHRDKDALLAEISDLKAKLENSQLSAAKMESKAAEEGRMATASAHKDGASDSDSSAMYNDEASASAYSGIQVLDERHLAGFMYHSSPLLLQDSAREEVGYMEEVFLSGEELCSSLFSEEAPSLSWYCSGGWD